MRSTVIRATKTAGFLLLAIFANPLFAQTIVTENNSSWYMGGNIGMSTTNIDKDKIVQNITPISYSDDDNDMGYKLFGGYKFNENFALEGGYFNLGEFGYSLTTSSGSTAASMEIMGLDLDAVGILPIAEDFLAFGRVGVIYAQVKDSFSTNGTISMTDTSPSESDFGHKFGAGLEYVITDVARVRLEAERYRVSDAVGNNADINLFSVGLTYRFGATKEAIPVAEKEEAIVPAEEAKEEVAIPVVVEVKEILIVVTAADAPEKIKESVIQKKIVALVFEEIHFEFDKSTLNKEAKEALKRNIALLDKNSNNTMLVIGHTSLSGTKEYNQDLSEQRAQSVKDYLVEEKIFAADKISIIGYGETRPIQYEAKPNKKVYSKAAKANMRVLVKIVHE